MSINGCILYPEQYNFIWKTSFLSLFSFTYAIYKGHTDLALVAGGVFLTSINYWRKPTYSWRRKIDMVYVKTALLYQLIRAYKAEYRNQYYITIFIAICFYPISYHYYYKKQYWKSTYAHSMLHLIANISNIVLYSGMIEPIW
jgi:hypothetical protein